MSHAIHEKLYEQLLSEIEAYGGNHKMLDEMLRIAEDALKSIH
jgi:hypothetical protein